MFEKRRRGGTTENNIVKAVTYWLAWVLALGIGACGVVRFSVLPDYRILVQSIATSRLIFALALASYCTARIPN